MFHSGSRTRWVWNWHFPLDQQPTARILRIDLLTWQEVVIVFEYNLEPLSVSSLTKTCSIGSVFPSSFKKNTPDICYSLELGVGYDADASGYSISAAPNEST